MQIPHREILAPAPMLEAISKADENAQTVAVDGRAKDLAALSRFPRLRTLWISRVGAKAAQVIGRLATLERLTIHDFRVADATALSDLQGLRTLIVAGSPKLKSLSGVEDLTGLRELILFDCPNLSDLGPLEPLTELRTLCLEGGFSKLLRVANLRPLAALEKLTRLRLASIRTSDQSLKPLHGLMSLQEVFIADTFPDAELEATARALPSAKGDYLDRYR